MIIEFPAPAQLLNLNDRMHWRTKANLTARWRTAVFYHAANFINQRRDIPFPFGPSTVKLTLPVKSLKTRRDPSNWSPTTKVCVDALVDARFWPDDNSEWVTTLEPEFWTSGMVLVEINPRQP